MSQQQYNQLLSNLLKEKQALTLLRTQIEGKRRENAGSAGSLNTWPVTVGIRRRREENQNPKISLRY